MVAELPIFLASAMRFLLALIILIPPGLAARRRAAEHIPAILADDGTAIPVRVVPVHGFFALRPDHDRPGLGRGHHLHHPRPAWGVIAWLFLGDRPSRRTGLGIILSVLGVAAINLVRGGGSHRFPTRFFGNLLVLGAVAFESVFLLIRKTVPEPLSPLAVSTIISVFGSALVPAHGHCRGLAGTDFSAITAVGWLVVVYYGAFVTVLAYLFWFAGITGVPPSTAGVFTAVMPVSALVLSALVLGESIGWQQLTGCACVLGGTSADFEVR